MKRNQQLTYSPYWSLNHIRRGTKKLNGKRYFPVPIYPEGRSLAGERDVGLRGKCRKGH